MTADVSAKLAGGLVSPSTVLCEGLGDDDVQIASQTAIDGAERLRRLVADDGHRVRNGPPGQVIRQTARQKLVHDDAKAVHVAARVDRRGLTAQLLGAHVGQRADELPDAGHDRGELSVGVGEASDAEVQNLRLRRKC